MVTIVVAGERAEQMIAEAKRAGCQDVMALSSTASSKAPVTGVPSVVYGAGQTAKNCGAALREAINQSKNSKIILIDSNSLASAEQLAEIVKSINGLSSVVAYLPLQYGESSMDSAPNSVDEIFTYISGGKQWPVALAAIDRSFAQSISDLDSDSLSEAIGHMIIAAISQGEQVQPIETSELSSATGAPLLSQTALSRMLNRAIRSNNIEELFPAPSWSSHQDETAALCFQRLAALFMKFNDKSAAAECLAQSEALEDSPRTLALRGLLAEEKGETLEAVAQMVSSLQKYEVRKKENEKHAVSFTPKNLDEINQNLYAGLDALNKRDNQTALEHFTKAVFNFDPFYEEFGLKKGR